MSLTQMQIIQSLGEAMSWLERELSWCVPATELRHLSGRIGELYEAMITNGQMATNVNQQGYDVVSDIGERISVKTTARIENTGHISFNPNTLALVDRIIILRINTNEMQVEILFNDTTNVASQLMTKSKSSDGKNRIALTKLMKKPRSNQDIPVTKTVKYNDYLIEELESGTIQVRKGSELLSPVKPILRSIAVAKNMTILNGNGHPFNTRQLGTFIINILSDTDS